MIDRILPHDIQAEQGLISAILIDNKEFENCTDLDANEFYSPAHQKIWASAVSLFSKQKPVDLVTLAVALRERNELEAIGGASYLASIADSAPIALNTSAYAGIISDMAIKRSIISFAQESYERAMRNHVSTQELISYVQSEAMKMQQGKRGDSIQQLKDIIDAHISQMKQDNETEQERGLILGFPRIDKILRVNGPKLVIVAGRPSIGKTAFSVTCARNMSHLGVNVGFLSIEMPKNEIINRWLSMETGINSMKFNMYEGLDKKEFEKITDAAGMMYDWPLQIDDSGSIWIEDVERKCRKMVREGAQVIFIDQASKIKGKTGDQYRDFTTNCNRVADLKKELGIPIFLLAQINRGVEQRSDKRPTMADLKQTGAFEEDADVVILLHRPEYYEADETKKAALSGKAEVNIAKNRNGAVFLDSKILYEGARGMFYQGD